MYLPNRLQIIKIWILLDRKNIILESKIPADLAPSSVKILNFWTRRAPGWCTHEYIILWKFHPWRPIGSKVDNFNCIVFQKQLCSYLYFRLSSTFKMQNPITKWSFRSIICVLASLWDNWTTYNFSGIIQITIDIKSPK